jgi:hypothetical protein
VPTMVVIATGMRGRLNSIQKSMLQWNELHPYSAVHVVQVRGALDAQRLHTAVNFAVQRHGLASLRIDAGSFGFEYHGGAPEAEIRTLCGPEPVLCALAAEIERQLNLRFSFDGPFFPFRFLVLPAPDSFFFGVSYFHPAADAESVVYLLRDIVAGYLQGIEAGASAPFDLYPDPRAQRLSRRPTVFAHKVLGFPGQMRRLRQSHRPPNAGAEDMSNGFILFTLGPGELRALVDVAKSWEVTLNDLFIALLMKALSPCAPGRQTERRRRHMSIGCIVNTRKDLGVDSPRVFGVFLGSFTVTHSVPDGISLRELSVGIRQQTSGIKRRRSYLAASVDLGLARFFCRLLSPARRKKFYAKNYPLWGGITNMNLNSIWNQNGRLAPMDYFRGVSTGPVTPLALSVTTVGDRINLGLSYRTAVFSRDDIQNCARRFRDQVEQTRLAA